MKVRELAIQRIIRAAYEAKGAICAAWRAVAALYELYCITAGDSLLEIFGFDPAFFILPFPKKDWKKICITCMAGMCAGTAPLAARLVVCAFV
jgi:hypothetical protein